MQDQIALAGSVPQADSNGKPQPIWYPTKPADQIPMNIYRDHINRKFNQQLQSSHELHRWSVEHPQEFWTDLYTYTKIIPSLPSTVTRAYDPSVPMKDVPKFFEGVHLNYAENVLSGRDPSKTALVGIQEGQNLNGEVWTWGTLTENVRQARSALLQHGVQAGDRVAAIISTSVWSVGLFLATASIGAIWTSISPDLGEEVGIRLTSSDNGWALTCFRAVSPDCSRSPQRCCSPIMEQHIRASNSRTGRRYTISFPSWHRNPWYSLFQPQI